MPVRISSPRVQVDGDERRGCLVWFHGGGLVLGTARQDDYFAGLLARAAGVVVVSVDYRLAPEHPFPAALDDGLMIWRWVTESAAALGVDPARMALGGQSAGGGIAASLAQRLRDQAVGAPPAAQLLFCPMLDDRTAARVDLDRESHFVWDNRSNRAAWRHYLKLEPGALATPRYAVPARRADLTGLAPCWIGVGDVDLFFEECREYAQRLTSAGVEVELRVVPGGPHAFEILSWRAELARAHRQAAARWLAARVADPPRAG